MNASFALAKLRAMATQTNTAFAYLSGGKIRVKNGAQSPRVIESKFAENLRERTVKAQQRHAWKGGGGAGNGFLTGPTLWGKAAQDNGAIPISITSISRGPALGQLFYSLETDSMCGVLVLDDMGTEERRIWIIRRW